MSNKNTKIQIEQKHLNLLQSYLKPGTVLPVSIEKQISTNYYAVKIRNITVKAYSTIDLRAKDVFVRVVETSPLPKLQLLFYEKNDFISKLSGQDLSLSYADFLLLEKAYPYLPKNCSLTEANELYNLLKFLIIKENFKLIPLQKTFKSQLSSEQLIMIYSAVHKNNLESNTQKRWRKVIRHAESPEIEALLNKFNKSCTYNDCQLERWQVQFFDKEIILPVETCQNSEGLERFSSCIITNNYGIIEINAHKKQIWEIFVDFENQIFQRSFASKFEGLKYKSITQNININLGISSMFPIDNELSVFDTIITN